MTTTARTALLAVLALLAAGVLLTTSAPAVDGMRQPVPSRSWNDVAQPPGIAPLPPGAPDFAAAPDLAAEPVTAAGALPPAQATRGPLPGEPTSRPLGLPAAMAVLAALGVASLIVRVLLAEPVDRSR